MTVTRHSNGAPCPHGLARCPEVDPRAQMAADLAAINDEIDARLRAAQARHEMIYQTAIICQHGKFRSQCCQRLATR